MIDERLSFLKDPIRFPKTNKRAVTDPKSQVSSDDINEIIAAIEDLNKARAMPPSFDVDLEDGCVYMADGGSMGPSFGINEEDGNFYYEYLT